MEMSAALTPMNIPSSHSQPTSGATKKGRRTDYSYHEPRFTGGHQLPALRPYPSRGYFAIGTAVGSTRLCSITNPPVPLYYRILDPV